MKKICWLFISMLCALLASCCYDYRPGDLLHESWICQMNRDPYNWIRNADYWFLTGRMPPCVCCPIYEDPDQAMTRTAVRAPFFNSIVTDGPFQVHIEGQQCNNTVNIEGPNAGTRFVGVEVHNNTVFIHELPTKNPCDRAAIQKVIVHIKVNRLCRLINKGGDIYGRGIYSPALAIFSSGCGDIMLAGTINLTNVTQMGSGTVTVIGACTPCLKINVIGNGCVNVTGHVGVNSIQHKGNGHVNIIGADSDFLNINASGNGYTNVIGCVALKNLTATDCSHVYVYWVNGDDTAVCANSNANVGLAGVTGNLHVDLADCAHFQGLYLQAGTVYVNTNDTAHANVSPQQRIYARATLRSSIYYSGSPTVSRFTSEYATVVPMWKSDICFPNCVPPPPDYVRIHRCRER